MKQLKKLFIAAALVAVPALSIATPAGAIKVLEDQCSYGNRGTAVCEARREDAGNMIQSVVNVLMFLLGAISTIMIIIGGIRYTTSNGDASQTTSAKNTILYAVVGLVVAICATAVVNFVIGRL